MYAWAMLTEFDCQSATCVKNAVVFYYTHTLHPPLMISMSTYGLVSSVLLCWSCLTTITRRASPCSQFSTYLRDLLARRNLYIAAFRARGLAAKWCWLHYNEAQGAVFCFCGISMCLWLHFKYFTWFGIATMHAWIQLAVPLILMYYCGNTASIIGRDLTRRLSFIIIGVWLFGEPKCSE